MNSNPTRNKLREAQYFLQVARASVQNDDLFAFNLSACLSASRSVTFYMQKQYGKVPGFADWYCARQIEMRADAELDYLNEARVESIHTKYVPVKSSRTATASLDAYIVDPSAPAPGPKAQPDVGETGSARTIVAGRSFLAFPDEEALVFCERQLGKLTELVRQCESKFLSASQKA